MGETSYDNNNIELIKEKIPFVNYFSNFVPTL